MHVDLVERRDQRVHGFGPNFNDESRSDDECEPDCALFQVRERWANAFQRLAAQWYQPLRSRCSAVSSTACSANMMSGISSSDAPFIVSPPIEDPASTSGRPQC